MGAYENPRFFNAPNYMAGTQAFIGTFKKGLEEGLQYGEDLIANRKEYEKGIYDKGAELKEELDAAVANSQMTKDQVQGALRQFYDDALAINVPAKKGLGGLFVKAQEKRLGDLDLQEVQNSFTDAVAGINTAFNYTYDPEIDIMENEDRGHPQFKNKKAIYDQIKNGSANPNFNYTGGKFDGGITVQIPDDENPGKMKSQTFSSAEIQAMFNASGKEQRDIIDAKHDETLKGIFNETNAAVDNIMADAKYKNESKIAITEAEALAIVRRRMGIAQDGKLSQVSRDFINDEYNNHANISEQNKVSILSEKLAGFNLSEDEIKRIANEPFDIGDETYVKRYSSDKVDWNLVKNAVEAGKRQIVEESYMQELRDMGLVNKANRKTIEAPKGGDKYDPNKVDAYLQQKINNETLSGVNTFIDTQSEVLSNIKMPSNFSKFSYADGVVAFQMDDGSMGTPSSEANLKLEQQEALKEFGDQFINAEFTYRGGKENASRVEFSGDGRIKLYFEPKTIEKEIKNDQGVVTKIESIPVENDTLSFNLYNPESMRKYFDAIATEAGGSGEYARNAYSAGYDKYAFQEYASADGLNRLNAKGQPMGKWIKFISDKGGQNILFNFIKNNSGSLNEAMKSYRDKNIAAYNTYIDTQLPG